MSYVERSGEDSGVGKIAEEKVGARIVWYV